MGAAIAAAFSDAGYRVALVERDAQAAAAGAARVADIYDAAGIASGRLAQAQADERHGRIAAGDDWNVLAEASTWSSRPLSSAST